MSRWLGRKLGHDRAVRGSLASESDTFSIVDDYLGQPMWLGNLTGVIVTSRGAVRHLSTARSRGRRRGPASPMRSSRGWGTMRGVEPIRDWSEALVESMTTVVGPT